MMIGRCRRLDGLVGLVNEEFHLVEFLQQVVGELDIGLVDLVDQQNGTLFGLESLPQLALLDVVAHIVDLVHTQLGITQAAHRIIFIEPLVGLGGGLDMPGDQLGAHGFGELLGEHGLARTGLTLDQQGALQGDGGVDSELEIVCGDVGLGTFELHEKFLEPGPALAGDQPMDSPGLYPGPGMGVNAGKVFTISFRLRYRVLATGRASPIDAFPVGA